MYMQNNWNAIRALYRSFNDRIMAAPTNEWGMDPYAWDSDNIIFLTPIETWLWADIRANDAVLYPQYPVLDFFVDFANPKAKVAIECDGAAYHMDKAKDAARDKRLTDAGWSVYRISGASCRMECDEETGAPSVPHLFIQRICNRHDISRNGREETGPHSGDFLSTEESVTRWWKWASAERARRRSGE